MTKRYDKEFKKETIRLIQGEGKTVAQVARELELHENTLYRWLSEFKQDALVNRRIFLDSRRLYGSKKVWEELKKQGLHLSEKTVVRVMKELGLKSRTVKKYKATTNSKHNLPVYDNVLNQKFTAQDPNQVWMADITYIHTDEGWLYLASIMDLYSRKIVGWQMSDRMTKSLVVDALDQAYCRQRPAGEVLHHSDRGSQYASLDYQNRLKTYKMKGSMSRKGNCYDNACMESFHSVLKKELIYLEHFKTRAEAKKQIFEYLACFYNGKRIHSSIGYFTPNQYERMYHLAV
ncbi:Transposase InsO and inactivated derivatives [Paenibacillus sp. 1_12]|uniref:IS3 family transposase n=1 Tax=Paenibacillus sp. 1_12 TaxID=1566278 RepID=UPI0008E290C3|nr:IS3 family transposase [Paenibacillus sp. 1_12]SFM49256.1 Transposase InsO and inactivated derivatives [Paenibacillus sp. 1_12]